MSNNKWKQSTVKTNDVQAKIDARNKVIELKAQYEAEVPKLEDAVQGLFDFLFRKPDLANKYDFTNFEALKATKLNEAVGLTGFFPSIAGDETPEGLIEKLAKHQFQSMPVEQQKMIKFLYLFRGVKVYDNDERHSYKIEAKKAELAQLITSFDIGEKVVFNATPDLMGRIFSLADSYKEYFDWFQNKTWSKADLSQARDSIKGILGFELTPNSNLYGGQSLYQLQKNVTELNAKPDFILKNDFSKLPTVLLEFKAVQDALDSVSKMHDTYTTVLTLGELVDNNAPTKPTPSAFEWIKGYFNSFWDKSAKPVEKADSSLFSSKTTDDSEEDNFDAQDEDGSTAISTNVVEVAIDSTETSTTIHNQYQGFVTQFLTSAKTHCFGKVIATQMLLANCQAYRLSTGKKDLECKNIEATVKIYTDHCEYAFPFGTDEDDYISQELLKAVEIKSGIHSNGILAFTGAGQEYSGFIVDSTKADAKKILGDYVKYVSHHITNEAEVLALPSGTTEQITSA